MGAQGLRLVLRRVIAATPSRLFEAWTTPAMLEAWWGPRGVRCTHAEVDARVGGRYRIGNELPDGRVLSITGEFVTVTAPTLLVYTWSIEPSPADALPERVTVRFEARGADTEVVICHERIGDEEKLRDHEAGWNGCLDGLSSFVDAR